MWIPASPATMMEAEPVEEVGEMVMTQVPEVENQIYARRSAC
jgi:hypothetical protein